MIPGQKGSKDCEKLEPLLSDYLHGELPRATAEQLAVHLEACGDCREALDDLRISAKLVSGAFEQSADPGLGFARLVMARINTAEQWLQGQRAFWRPFEAIAWRLAFSAALALVFLFAYGMRTNTETAATPVTSISSQQQDVFTVPVSATPSSNDEVLMAIAEKHHDR
jgi:anti-sigma factor RsiW